MCVYVSVCVLPWYSQRTNNECKRLGEVLPRVIVMLCWRKDKKAYLCQSSGYTGTLLLSLGLSVQADAL